MSETEARQMHNESASPTEGRWDVEHASTDELRKIAAYRGITPEFRKRVVLEIRRRDDS